MHKFMWYNDPNSKAYLQPANDSKLKQVKTLLIMAALLAMPIAGALISEYGFK